MAFTHHPTFEQFRDSGFRNAWIRWEEMEIYIRKSLLPYRQVTTQELVLVEFELANLNNPVNPGQGSFTRFLDILEPQYGLYIENVSNARLVEYLKRRDYVIMRGDPTFGPSLARERRIG